MLETLKNLLLKTAPFIASMIGGPFSGMAVGALTEKLLPNYSGLDAVSSLVTLIRSNPDSLVELRRIDNEFKVEMQRINLELKQLDHEESIAQAQINQASVSTGSTWSRWRDMLGWTGTIVFLYIMIIVPIFAYFSITLPTPNLDLIMKILVRMLGLSGVS